MGPPLPRRQHIAGVDPGVRGLLVFFLALLKSAGSVSGRDLLLSLQRGGTGRRDLDRDQPQPDLQRPLVRLGRAVDVGLVPAGRRSVPGGRHDHRVRRGDHRHLPVRDHAGPDGGQGALRPRGPRAGRRDLHLLPALVVPDLRAFGAAAARRRRRRLRCRPPSEVRCPRSPTWPTAATRALASSYVAVLDRALQPTARIDSPASEDKVTEKPNVAGLGEALYTDHLVTVGLSGVLLFVALVGAVAIANPKNRPTTPTCTLTSQSPDTSASEVESIAQQRRKIDAHARNRPVHARCPAELPPGGGRALRAGDARAS